MSESSGRSVALEGEDIATTHWEDARHWMSVCADLIRFKLILLDPALYPEEVRNYVMRLRKVLARLQIPCDLVNRTGLGYSLQFRADRELTG